MLMLLMIVTGMYRYLYGALADTFTLIPVNGAVFHSQSLLNSMLTFLTNYVIIGFRIVLPIFCVMLLLNAILGVLAKVSPQMNMFVVGMQLKIFVGIFAVLFTIIMLPAVSTFIEDKIHTLLAALVRGMSP